MKRISTAVLLLLFASQVPAVNVWNQWKEYETWAQAYYPESAVALAQAPDGSVTYEWGATADLARNRALRKCETSKFPQDSGECHIVDINLESKGKLSTPFKFQAQAEHKRLKKETTTASSPSIVYCATSNTIWTTTDTRCRSLNGKAFLTKAEADAERQRLKKTTTATTSESKSVWCAAESRAFESTKADCKSKKLKDFPTKHQADEHRRLVAADKAQGWCVSSNSSITFMRDSVCRKKKGVLHSSKSKAEAALQRDKDEEDRFDGIGILVFGLFVAGIWILTGLGRSNSGPDLRVPPKPATKPFKHWQQPDKPTVPRPVAPKTKSPPKTRARQREDPRERLLGIESSWSIEKKRNHLRQEFNKWNARIVSLPEGSRRNEAQEKLRICGELMAEYGP